MVTDFLSSYFTMEFDNIIPVICTAPYARNKNYVQRRLLQHCHTR